MTRLARDRDTQLTPEEIAIEALRQYDAGGEEPSIRRLAKALNVTPSAIYHHYPSHARIVQAAVELVWVEATGDLLELLPDPFAADPAELVLHGGIATRRAFGRHPRLARHIADAWRPSDALTAVLGVLASAFERMGLSDERAAEAFHAYGTFTIGSVLFAAARTNAQVLAPDEQSLPYRPAYDAELRQHSDESTRRAIDGIMDLAALDPDRDEQLFISGLRHLIGSFSAVP